MKFILSVLMLSLLGLNVSCNRDNDMMEREEAPLERAGDNIEEGADEVGDDIEDGAEELDN